MKKYFVLTSLFALVACASGGVSGPTGPDSPGLLRASTLIGDSAGDNNEITSMASAVVVKDGTSYSSIARAAHAPDKTSHSGYTIYKLDNVDFKLVGEEDATFNFEINDEGRIVRAVGNGQTIERDTTDTTIFHGKIFQFVKDGSQNEVITVMDNDSSNPVTQEILDAKLAAAVQSGTLTQEEADNGQWNYLEQNWKFDTKGSNKQLTYSDFGYFTSTNIKKLLDISFDENGDVQGTDNGSNHESVMLFSGGYDILPETVKPAKGASYKGTAIGIINTSIDGTNQTAAREQYEHNWGDSGQTYRNKSETAKLMTDEATLEIDSETGATKIFMPFGSDGSAVDTRLSGEDANVQWYNVRINDGQFTFEVPDDLTESDITKRFAHDDDSGDNPTQVVNERYYGVTTPVEATGSALYDQEHNLDAGTKREFEFQAAYGMKK